MQFLMFGGFVICQGLCNFMVIVESEQYDILIFKGAQICLHAFVALSITFRTTSQCQCRITLTYLHLLPQSYRRVMLLIQTAVFCSIDWITCNLIWRHLLCFTWSYVLSVVLGLTWKGQGARTCIGYVWKSNSSHMKFVRQIYILAGSKETEDNFVAARMDTLLPHFVS